MQNALSHTLDFYFKFCSNNDSKTLTLNNVLKCFPRVRVLLYFSGDHLSKKLNWIHDKQVPEEKNFFIRIIIMQKCRRVIEGKYTKQRTLTEEEVSLYRWPPVCLSFNLNKAANSKQNKQEVGCTVILPLQ